MKRHSVSSFTRFRQLWSRAIAVLVFLSLIGTLAPSPLAGQPLCPFDKVWDEETNVCVPVEPTEVLTPESTLPPEPTTEPARTMEMVPTMAPTEPDADAGEDQAPEEPVTVSLIAYTCPPDVVDEVITEHTELALRCGVNADEVGMEIVTTDGAVSMTTELGIAEFAEMPAGAIQVRETVPDGYGEPLVFCLVISPNGETIKALNLETIGSDGFVTIDHVPGGTSALCEFYNLPEVAPETDDESGTVPTTDAETVPTTDATEDATPGVEGTVQFFLADWLEDAWDEVVDLFDGMEFSAKVPMPSGVFVYQYLCPEPSWAFSGQKYLAMCPEMPAERQQIVYDLRFNESASSYLLGPSQLTWYGSMPGGTVTFGSQYGATGLYDPPVVACVGFTWVEEEGKSFLAVAILPTQLSSSGSITLTDVPASASVHCKFFYWESPVTDLDVTVDMIAYVCPEQVVTGQIGNYSDLILLCGLPGGQIQMQVNTGTIRTLQTNQGVATFTDLPAGVVKVRQRSPTDYGVPLVFSTVTGDDGRTYEQRDMEIIGNFQYVTIPDVPRGANVLCEYFNRPVPTGSAADLSAAAWREESAMLGSRRRLAR